MKTTLLIGICLILQTDCTMISSSCLSRLSDCIPPDLCRSQQALLRNVCVSEDSSCQSPEGCNVTVQAILVPSTVCVCADENPCSVLQLLASFCHSPSDIEPFPAPDKPKAPTQQESSRTGTLPPPSDHHLPSTGSTTSYGHKNNLRDEQKENRLLSSDISCVQGMTLCIQNEACNRQLVPFVQSCSSPHCSEELCRLAAIRFYSSLSEAMAEILVFCYCEPDDQDCHHFQTMLNSNSCKHGQIGQWSCLEMLDNCTGEEICRRTFQAFLSKCFSSEDVSLSGYSTTDLLHVIDLDFFVGENKDCRLAFVATMGSVLQSMCTCHGLDHHTLYRCNVLQQAIQNRSYFRPQGPDQNNILSTNSKENESHQEHSWLNARLLYVVVSACVLVAIIALAIALVMHKLRKKHNLSMNPELSYKPPEDSAKSLVL